MALPIVLIIFYDGCQVLYSGIASFGRVINQSLGPLDVRDPVLSAKRRSESPCIH
jgi:hypothetical protein